MLKIASLIIPSISNTGASGAIGFINVTSRNFWFGSKKGKVTEDQEKSWKDNYILEDKAPYISKEGLPEGIFSDDEFKRLGLKSENMRKLEEYEKLKKIDADKKLALEQAELAKLKAQTDRIKAETEKLNLESQKLKFASTENSKAKDVANKFENDYNKMRKEIYFDYNKMRDEVYFDYNKMRDEVYKEMYNKTENLMEESKVPPSKTTLASSKTDENKYSNVVGLKPNKHHSKRYSLNDKPLLKRDKSNAYIYNTTKVKKSKRENEIKIEEAINQTLSYFTKIINNFLENPNSIISKVANYFGFKISALTPEKKLTNETKLLEIIEDNQDKTQIGTIDTNNKHSIKIIPSVVVEPVLISKSNAKVRTKTKNGKSPTRKKLVKTCSPMLKN